MRAYVFKFISALLIMASCLGATAAEQQAASKDEAVAMVKKAVSYIRQNGKDKAFAEFSRPKGQFVDRELYIAALDLNGVMLAHGANPKLIGKTLLDIKDVNGKAFVREQIELAKTKGSGWVEFEWVNPVSEKMERRYTYLERIDDYFVLSGVYKK
ncbi:signal transduction histidine kinase [Duganella sp. SG902]|uniref:cache domain-containing protein n=1 Tax=Duganella sp. SG902 TaxID=2587016 RepID=UPI00159DEF39|nr:cache domain-containing protein [Duganella sp. SG902]NVM78418.1 signal transduction histidine kinase [Duganella sp. SG902]